MSDDKAVTKDLIPTLEDGKDGFAKAADQLDGDGRADIAERFRALSAQRASFADELRSLATSYGDEIKESGSVAAAVHRGWMALKDALSGSDPDGVLDVAEQGEDHAVSVYDKALSQDLSPTLRAVVERQYATVKSAHDEVKAQRDRA